MKCLLMKRHFMNTLERIASIGEIQKIKRKVSKPDMILETDFCYAADPL